MRRYLAASSLAILISSFLQTSICAKAAEDAAAQVEKPRPRIGLALGGGGTKAAAHLGVLRVFQREGIPVDYIAGTSIGSTIGGFYSSGMSLDELSDLVLNAKLTKAMIPPMPMIILYGIARHISPFRHKHYAGLLSGKQYKKYLARHLNNMQIEDTKIPFTAVTTDLVEGKEYNLQHGDLSAAMVASSAITPLIKPQEIDGKLLVDGGVVNNLPVDVARSMGANIVIAVCVDTSLQPIKPEDMRSFRKLTGRVSDIYFYSKDERSMAAADLTIYPNVDAVRLAERGKKRIAYAVKQGEIAAEKALPKIRALLNGESQDKTATASTKPAG